jgi:8-oxo-dGTP pyrophosphatase MutT (NUDIX family)
MNAPARPASTVVLARRSSGGFEVFLVRRHDNIAFMGGAHVFPGGRVDDADYADDPLAWCDGGADPRMRDRSVAEAIAFHVAAVRELFEEAGVLLARGADGQMVRIAGDAVTRFDAYRRGLLDGSVTLREIVGREQLRLALDALALFAHWVTPFVETRRFDTYFFLAVAPESQTATHDEQETTHGVWVAPGEALERCLRNEIALPPPTWTTLRALSRFATVEDAWRWARRQPVPLIQPCFQENPDGSRVVLLPGDPRCPGVDGFEAQERRFLLENGRWRPVTS